MDRQLGTVIACIAPIVSIIRPSSTLRIDAVNGVPTEAVGGTVRTRGAMLLTGVGGRYVVLSLDVLQRSVSYPEGGSRRRARRAGA